MNNIKSVDKDIINETDGDLLNILLFGCTKYHINSKILNFSIDKMVLQSTILRTRQCQ